MKLFCKIMCAALILASVAGAYVEVNSINDVKDCKAYWEQVGEESTANLNKLEDGINTLSDNHDEYISGKAQLAKGEVDYAAGVVKLENGRKELAAGIAKFNAGKKTLTATEQAFGGKGCPVLKQAYDGVNELKVGYSNTKAYKTVADKGGDYNTIKAMYESVSALISEGYTKEQAVQLVAQKTVNQMIQSQMASITADITADVRQQAAEDASEDIDRQEIEAGIRSQHEESLKADFAKANPEATESEINAHVEKQIDSKTDAAVNQQTAAAVNEYMASAEAKEQIDKGVAVQKVNIMSDMLSDLVSKIDAAYTNVHMLVSPHSHDEALAIAASANGLSVAQMSQAYDGYVQYSQGAAQLASAEGQLAAGKQKLANGEKELVAGNLKLMDGRKQLAEFENGRAQVADGLDTAISTQPEGGIKSIKSRLGDNFDYMAKDGENLNYNKAMSVVEAAREYQADSTEVVTAELTGRVVGAVAGLAAALFGIIASILVLLGGSRNGMRKAGFVTACLSALAAIVCIVKVAGAGTAMSVAAGSAIGMMPVVIAVICAVIALSVAGTAMARR